MALPPYQKRTEELDRAIPEEPRALGCCCCGVTTALKCVGIFESVYLGFCIGGAVYQIVQGNFFSFIGLLILFFGLYAVSRLLPAIKESLPTAVLPYIVWKYIHLVMCIIAIGGMAYLIEELEDSYTGLLIGLLVFICVIFVLGIMFVVIAHQAKGYLTRKSLALAPSVVFDHSAVIAQSQPPPPYAYYYYENHH